MNDAIAGRKAPMTDEPDAEADWRAHDAQACAAFRANLLRLVTGSEQVFRVLDDWEVTRLEAVEWLPVLERRLAEVTSRSNALQAHIVHVRNLVALEVERQAAKP